MTRAPYTPQSDSALVASVDWLNELVLGSLAVGLCVIAVAVVGLMMFGGRLPVRAGLRVILGCFILLGAPVIAAGLMGVWGTSLPLSPAPSDQITEPQRTEELPPRQDLPPSAFDPYAGASIRRD